MHNDFTLFMRTYPNGKKVVFYHAYDENGRRVGPWTTNNLTLTAARNYCHRLIRAGALIPNKNKIITFGVTLTAFGSAARSMSKIRKAGRISPTHI